MTGRRSHVTRAGEGPTQERYAGLRVRSVLDGEVTGEDLAIVEFGLDARRLVPPHKHVAEDEVSYVLEGEVGFRVGDETFTASAGTSVYKPRGVFHTFWNATDQPARILEVIVPAGLERSFVGKPTPPGRPPNVHSDEWVAGLKERYGLRLLGE